MTWLLPWQALEDYALDDPLVRELRRELCASHVLFGIPVRAIGCRQDCDDVLFELQDGSTRLAVVHLTYAQHPEPHPTWPETQIFEDWDGFAREEMIPVHEDWNRGL